MELFTELTHTFSNNPKQKQFIEYIHYHNPTTLFETALQATTANDILDAIKDYVSSNKINSRSQIALYRAEIVKLFAKIQEEYHITNPCFYNSADNSILYSIIKDYEASFPDPVERDIAKKEEYEDLKVWLEKKASEFDFTDMIERLERPKATRYTIYPQVVSVIAALLILYFGLRNNVVAKLKLNDYSSYSHEIIINEFAFSVPEKLYTLLDNYLVCRAHIAKKYPRNDQILLIQANGDSFLRDEKSNSASAYGQLFTVITSYHKRNFVSSSNTSLKKTNISVAMERFAYYRVLQYFHERIYDIEQIIQITSFKQEKCVSLLEYYWREYCITDKSDRIYHFNRQLSLTEGEEPSMNCPYCMRKHSPAAENWGAYTLDGVHYYIACDECKGGVE